MTFRPDLWYNTYQPVRSADGLLSERPATFFSGKARGFSFSNQLNVQSYARIVFNSSSPLSSCTYYRSSQQVELNCWFYRLISMNPTRLYRQSPFFSIISIRWQIYLYLKNGSVWRTDAELSSVSWNYKAK